MSERHPQFDPSIANGSIMPWRNATISGDLVRLGTDVARMELKLDAAISQAASDRSLTQAHIAECNLRNKIADEEEVHAKLEWEKFKTGAADDIDKLSKQVSRTQTRLSLLIAAVGGVAWAADHFHWLFPH